jgi:hypothetical protein
MKRTSKKKKTSCPMMKRTRMMMKREIRLPRMTSSEKGSSTTLKMTTNKM